MPVHNVFPFGIQNIHPAELLQGHGLLLNVEVNVSDALAQILIEQNQAIPSAIAGRALVDTGASICAVDEESAVALGLQPVGQSSVSGVGGTQIRNVYVAKILFPGTPIPQQEWTLTGADLKDQNLLVLIGRDILRNCVLVYNGPMGCYTLAF
jgi:hypothetical protein